MKSFNGVVKALVISIVLSLIVLLIFFRSAKLSYNFLGILIVIVIEVMAYKSIREELRHDLPDSSYKREDIIIAFSNRYSVGISDEDRQAIVDATYYSNDWERELEAMTNDYANLGMWYTKDDKKMCWLRVYLAAFPVKEISSDIDEQYSITVEKHFINLYKAICKRDFLTNEEIIKYINETFLLNFDKNSFAVWKAYMKDNDFIIKLKNEGQVGFDTDINKLMRNYSDNDDYNN